jgi:hypothetical protein
MKNNRPQKTKKISWNNYRSFILVSIIIHIVFIIIFANQEVNSKIIITNTENSAEIVEIDDISDEEIFTAMKQIKSDEEQSLMNKTLQEKNNLKLKEQLTQIKNLEKKEKLIKDQIKNQEKEFINKNIKIKKLKDDKEDLDKINKELKDKIDLKKKVSKVAKRKKYFKKDSDYQKNFSKYINKISYNFRKNWVIPVNAESSWSCTVKVIQDSKGKLKEFDIFDNCPADPDFLRSIDRAIKASTPLPQPPSELDFNDIKEITLEFKMNF